MADADVPWDEYHEEQRQRGQAAKVKNLAVLRAITLRFEVRNDGDIVLVRVPGAPIIEFYPTKNKWRTDGRTMVGTAADLVAWLKRRTMQ
jgi:hypothetical protein